MPRSTVGSGYRDPPDPPEPEDEAELSATETVNAIIDALEPLEPTDRADVLTAAAAMHACDLSLLQSASQTPSARGVQAAKRKAFTALADALYSSGEEIGTEEALLAAAAFFGFRLERDPEPETD